MKTTPSIYIANQGRRRRLDKLFDSGLGPLESAAARMDHGPPSGSSAHLHTQPRPSAGGSRTSTLLSCRVDGHTRERRQGSVGRTSKRPLLRRTGDSVGDGREKWRTSSARRQAFRSSTTPSRRAAKGKLGRQQADSSAEYQCPGRRRTLAETRSKPGSKRSEDQQSTPQAI